MARTAEYQRTNENGAKKTTVEFARPKYTMPVHLPYVHLFDYPGRKMMYGFHTDVASSFQTILNWDLKRHIREGLLIQGRVLTWRQWQRLQENPVFQFFLRGRDHRTQGANQRHVLEMIVPKSVAQKISPADLRKYVFAEHPFTPETTAKEIGYKVGWYPADMLTDMTTCIETSSPVALIPILGGVTQFLIGTNDLKAGHLRIVAAKIMYEFEAARTNIVHTRAVIEREKIVAAGNEILEFPIK